mmetsp:Transcript_10860/g.16271  ORF Transcript_10860/g.16271 Transcript_10860/m.16271 type:complete len:122 (+) Transcript_10860:630-995(+)
MLCYTSQLCYNKLHYASNYQSRTMLTSCSRSKCRDSCRCRSLEKSVNVHKENMKRSLIFLFKAFVASFVIRFFPATLRSFERSVSSSQSKTSRMIKQHRSYPNEMPSSAQNMKARFDTMVP